MHGLLAHESVLTKKYIRLKDVKELSLSVAAAQD
jgi:hypothetical protein